MFSGLLGSLFSGATNLIGGLFGQQNQANINQANIAEQQFLDTHHIQDVVSDAKAAGINPLAALGVNTPSAPVQVGSDALSKGISGAGQDIGRAISSYMAPEDKEKKLNEQLLQAKIDQTNTETASMQMRNSVNARTFAAAGSAPGLPYNPNLGGPPDPRPSKGRPTLFTEYYDPYDRSVHPLLSSEASQSTMTSASLPMAAPIGARLFGRNWDQGWRENVRPDVARSVDNLGAAPDIGYGPYP
jgi:hypothetical protein